MLDLTEYCFRRTLVGLKHRRRELVELVDRRFQTYPRGVEAVGLSARKERAAEFQTYPRGVEAAATSRARSATEGFRRTLVGLKPSAYRCPRR